MTKNETITKTKTAQNQKSKLPVQIFDSVSIYIYIYMKNRPYFPPPSTIEAASSSLASQVDAIKLFDCRLGSNNFLPHHVEFVGIGELHEFVHCIKPEPVRDDYPQGDFAVSQHLIHQRINELGGVVNDVVNESHTSFALNEFKEVAANCVDQQLFLLSFSVSQNIF